MRRVVATELVSMDDVVESPDEWAFSYTDEEMAAEDAAGMAASDALLLGWVTYEEFASFWPNQPGGTWPIEDGGLSGAAAGEEPVGDEGDQRHEHDRPEYCGEQHHEQDPEQSERSAPSPEASPAEAPPLERQEDVRHGAHEQRDGVQGPFEVPRQDRVEVSHIARCSLRRNRACLLALYQSTERRQPSTKHYQGSGHPIVASFQPGEDWRYCYVDETLV